MKKIKEVISKINSRVLYLQNKKLMNTKFKAGTHYRYILDIKSKQIIIVPTNNEEDRTVSKRKLSNGLLKPVIDIKGKKAKEDFSKVFGENVDYLQIDIYKNRIVIKSYEDANESLVKKLSSIAKKAILKKNSNLIDISDLISVKKKKEIILKLDSSQQVVGLEPGFTQYISSITSTISDSYTKQAVENVGILPHVCSLYSGAGLLDLGFILQGFKVIFGIEMSKEACDTYRYNIGDHIVNADILKYDIDKIPKTPITIGGSPCVVYTKQNQYTNAKDVKYNGRMIDHPKNALLRRFVEAVKKNENCRVFVHENVPEVETINNGQLLEEIKEELSDFKITHGVLCAADYGSPQLRYRSIIIGSKLGISIPHPEPMYSPNNYKTVREALEGLHDEKIPNQRDYSISKPDTLLRMSYVKEGGNGQDIPEELRTGKFSNSYRRLAFDRPSVALPNIRKSSMMPPHSNKRILSVREVARLQDLPDDFIFKGSLSSKQMQVCNGVPINLGQAIARKVMEAIKEYNRRAIGWQGI